ncbi:MAG: glycoside hydrolase family 55 protein [Actinomycetota bacterium]|nr:glycoside hydrolase family 55 protein [Actinomycetota bacterium]
MGPVVDVRSQGAVGDGLADDTAAIQRAVDAAQAAGGATVLFPPGRYLVRSPGIHITRQLRFCGVGWQPASDPFPPAAPPNGSWLLCDDPASPVVSIHADQPGAAAGTCVEGLAIGHRQPPPAGGGAFEPGGYPAAITVGTWCTDVLLQDLFLLNPTTGIAVGGPEAVTGRVLMRRIWGQPLTTGIVVDGCYDILRLHDVHFWPFWVYGDGPGGVQKWVERQAAGITLYRCDNPMLTGVFCFGYAVGLALRQSAAGCPHKCKVSDSDFDDCGTGVLVSGVTATGVDPHTLLNVSMQGPEKPVSPSLGGIVVDRSASAVRLAVSNTSIYKFAGSGIHLAGPGSILLADNLFIHDVNRAGQGGAGIRAVGGARARVGWQREISVANGGPATDGHVELAVGVPAPGGAVTHDSLPGPPAGDLPDDPWADNPLLRPRGGAWEPRASG